VNVPATTIAFLGDAALAATMADADPLVANSRVHRVADAVRAARVPGVRDVVPGMRELVVHIDPRRCDVPWLERVLQTAAAHPPAGDVAPGPVIDIPVAYGGADGPDLGAVATACRLHPDDVCQRHAATEYVVCFIGFLPGFPYLGPLDATLRLPRRRSPRPAVPAGSVAIAGEYTGIYPWSSPGGWHLIGRTDVRLFDLAAEPPAALSAGARVRFLAR
jgi:KipI family sensor histidine kinase inhibitor